MCFRAMDPRNDALDGTPAPTASSAPSAATPFTTTTPANPPPDGATVTTLLGLFEAQVARTPGATAVFDEQSSSTLTYSELDRCARRTAAVVTALLAAQATATETAAAAAAAAAAARGGWQQAPKVSSRMQRTAELANADKSAVSVSGADRPVAVCADGLAAVVGVLAAWRLGRPFLALDPAHPPARLKQLARSVPSAVLLHNAPHPSPGAPPPWFAGMMGNGSGASEGAADGGGGQGGGGDGGGQAAAVVASCVLDPGSGVDDDDGAATCAADPARSGLGPGPGSELAYVMFTSGSTGTPKAVLGSHKAMYVPLSHCPTIHQSHCPSVPLSPCPPVPLSPCPTVPLSLCPPVPLSLCPTVPLSHCPSVPLSRCPTVPLFRCPSVPPSHCPTVPLSNAYTPPIISDRQRLAPFPPTSSGRLPLPPTLPTAETQCVGSWSSVWVWVGSALPGGLRDDMLTGMLPGPLCRNWGCRLHRFRWMLARFPIARTDVCCQTKPIAFVDFVWDCFGPLASGATLAIPPPAARRDVGELSAHLDRMGCTRLTMVPSVLAALLDLHESAALGDMGAAAGRGEGEGEGEGEGAADGATVANGGACTRTAGHVLLRSVRMLTVSGETISTAVFWTWA